MALGSIQPLTEMNTRSISWGKGGRCVRLTTLPPSCAVVTKSGSLNFLEPSGTVQSCNGTSLPLPLPISCLYANVLAIVLATSYGQLLGHSTFKYETNKSVSVYKMLRVTLWRTVARTNVVPLIRDSPT